MKNRVMKWTALVLTGGVVLQLAGCGPTIVNALAYEVLYAIIQNVIGATTAGTTG